MKPSKFIRRYLSLLLCLVTALSYSSGFVHAQLTNSYDCSRTLYGRCLNQGYFTGDNKNVGDTAVAFPLDPKFNYSQGWVFNPDMGIYYWAFPQVSGPTDGVNDAYTEVFISQINSYINGDFGCGTNPFVVDDDTNPGGAGQDPNSCYNARRNAIGAATIVNTMLNKNGSDYGSYVEFGTAAYGGRYAAGIQYARDNFSAWADKVRWYNSNNLVDWAGHRYNAPNHNNSTIINQATDGAFFNNTDGIFARSIVFRHPTQLDPADATKKRPIYEINRSCGNIVGELAFLPQSPPPPPPPPPPTTKPYLSVYGGDVQAGSGFGEGCAPANGSAQILTFNQGSGNYQGAGTRMAAFALGIITQFVSANGTGGNAPKSLSFSQTSGGTYGGNFGHTYCAPNYWAGVPATLPPLSLSSPILGEHKAVYWDGDVTITSNIVYPPWATLAEIPSFYLIVRGGNIYIDKSVTQLDGVFIAMPDGATGGTIYTCTNGATRYGASVPAAAAPAGCGSTLTINGAFIANQVKFLRNNGDINNATAAEIFNYGPELWVR